MDTNKNYQFPPLLSVDDLSRLIHRKQTTIIVDRVRRPESLPPDCTPPSQKSPVWLLDTVLAWYSSHQKPATIPQISEKISSKRGAPSKVERLAKAKRTAEISIPATN